MLIAVATSTGAGVDRPAGAEPVLGVALVAVSALAYAVGDGDAEGRCCASLSGLMVTWFACGVGMLACLPFAGQFDRRAARWLRRRCGGRCSTSGVVPDRDRLLDLGVRPQPQQRRPARRSPPTSCHLWPSASAGCCWVRCRSRSPWSVGPSASIGVALSTTSLEVATSSEPAPRHPARPEGGQHRIGQVAARATGCCATARPNRRRSTTARADGSTRVRVGRLADRE